MSFWRCLSRLSFHRNQIRVDANVKLIVRQASQVAPQWTLKVYRDKNELLLKDIKQAQESFVIAVESGNADDIAYEYANYRRFLQMLPDRSANTQLSRWSTGVHPLRPPIVSKAARTLAANAHTHTLKTLLEDCETLHDVQVDKETLKVVVNSLVSSGFSPEVYGLLIRHRATAIGSQKWTSGIWLVEMKGLAEAGFWTHLKYCIFRVASFDAQQRYSLLEVILKQNSEPVVEIVELILLRMQRSHLHFHEETYRLLKESSATFGSRMEEIASNYKADSPVAPTFDKDAALAVLKAFRKKGRYAFLTIFQVMHGQGFRADERTISHLMEDVTVLSELKFLETTMDVKANHVSWSKLIKNVLTKKGLPDALHIYEVAKERKITPDSAMVHPLLRSLCNPAFKEPDSASLDKALAIFRDLTRTSNADSETTKAPVADTAVYNTLLRALASSSMTSKYFPIALSLLREMAAQDVRMDPMTATSITILLIRSSRNHSEAIKAYRYVQSIQSDILDAKAYTAILYAYCSLSFDDQPYPPASGYFEIVRDMERRGIPRSAEVYTILLGRYAAAADRVRNIQDLREREHLRGAVETSIRNLHDHLTVDASVTPDAPLYNQLMDAYNRVGSMENVLTVWSLLSSTGRHTNASVSIVLDACGFSGQYVTANNICSSLLGSGFPFNLGNWNSWLECLCRLGRLPQALDVVCLEMPKKAETHPDQSTIRVLESFGRRTGRLDDVRSRIQHHFPDKWDTFSKNLRP